MKDMKTLNAREWARAESTFVDGQAARTLFDEAHETADSQRTLSVSKLRDAVRQGQAVTSLFQSGEPIPMNVLRIYRGLLEHGSLAVSDQARAASAGTVMARDIGPYRLEVEVETDAAFLIIELGAEHPPKSMTLLHEDGRQEKIDLPDPIDGIVQIGISKSDGRQGPVLDLLRDPQTAIYLH
ncbi:MAG: hypothetical protein ACR2OX_04270 [Methyloligellaceae bacterium]